MTHPSCHFWWNSHDSLLTYRIRLSLLFLQYISISENGGRKKRFILYVWLGQWCAMRWKYDSIRGPSAVSWNVFLCHHNQGSFSTNISLLVPTVQSSSFFHSCPCLTRINQWFTCCWLLESFVGQDLGEPTRQSHPSIVQFYRKHREVTENLSEYTIATTIMACLVERALPSQNRFIPFLSSFLISAIAKTSHRSTEDKQVWMGTDFRLRTLFSTSHVYYVVLLIVADVQPPKPKLWAVDIFFFTNLSISLFMSF